MTDPVVRSNWTPDVTVAAICQQNGRFLLVEEIAKSSNKVVFNQPAGHVEEGESVLEAVVRETLEETQCHFTPEALVGLYRLVSENGKTYFRYTISGQVSEPDLTQPLDTDIIRTHWLTLDQIRANASLRSPLVLACIEDYLADQLHPLSVLREL